MDLIRQVFTIGALCAWQALLLYVYRELYAPKLPLKLLLLIILLLFIAVGVQLG